MEDEMPERVPMLSETTLAVVYNGTADKRILTRRDLSGDPEATTMDILAWVPGSEIDFASWREFAGSDERALEMLQKQQHEFALLGPGAADFAASLEEEEFVFEEPVK